MDPTQFLPTIKFFLTAVLFIFLIRNVFKLKQLTMFIENFKKKTLKNILDFEKAQALLVEEDGTIDGSKLEPFVLRMEDIVNGFGFTLTAESFDSAMNKPQFNLAVYISIALQITGFLLVAHFLFGIAWLHLTILIIGLLLLLFLI